MPPILTNTLPQVREFSLLLVGAWAGRLEVRTRHQDHGVVVLE